jgi:hypothetical protein
MDLHNPIMKPIPSIIRNKVISPVPSISIAMMGGWDEVRCSLSTVLKWCKKIHVWRKKDTCMERESSTFSPLREFCTDDRYRHLIESMVGMMLGE